MVLVLKQIFRRRHNGSRTFSEEKTWLEGMQSHCMRTSMEGKAYFYKLPSNLLRVAFAFVVAIFNTFIIVAHTFGCKPIAKRKHLRGQ